MGACLFDPAKRGPPTSDRTDSPRKLLKPSNARLHKIRQLCKQVVTCPCGTGVGSSQSAFAVREKGDGQELIHPFPCGSLGSFGCLLRLVPQHGLGFFLACRISRG